MNELQPTTGDMHRLMEDDPRFSLCGLRREPDGYWIPERLKVTILPDEVTCRECKRRQETPMDEW